MRFVESVERAYHIIKVSYKFARENLFLAVDMHKAYFEKSVKKRDFCIGTKFLAKFPIVPMGVNPNFFKEWPGGYVDLKTVGN